MVRLNGEYCHLLNSISDKNNFAIAVQIMKQGPLTLEEIKNSVPLKESLVKKHLSELVDCSFVFSKKQKGKIRYYLNKSTVLGIIKVVGRHIKKHGSTYKSVSKN